MQIALSPFPDIGSHHSGARPPTEIKPEKEQTPNSPASDEKKTSGADGKEPKLTRVEPGKSNAAHLDPSTPEYQELQDLKNRDREVRAHEMAHLAAAGPHARGGPVYDYKRGADGRQYAVSGHVNLDTSPVPGDPEATLRKAEAIRRAALAPAEPSPQDRRIAMDAASMVTEARMAIAIERREALSANIDTGRSDRISDDADDPREASESKPQAIAARGSIIARLNASGAIPQSTSAGSRIDLQA